MDLFLHALRHEGEVVGSFHAGGLEVGKTGLGERFRGEFEEVLLIHPGGLVPIEARGGAVDAFEAEAFDEFAEREDLAVVFR